jgi:DNA-binding CsgD family transcriptional regulator
MVAKDHEDWQTTQRKREIELEAQADALLKQLPFDKTEPAYTETNLAKKERSKLRHYQRKRGIYCRTKTNEPLIINHDASLSCYPDTTPDILTSNVISALIKIADLTAKQVQVIDKLRQGHSMAEVGRQFGVSRNAIRKTRLAAYLKLQHAAKGSTLEELQDCYEKDVKR